jgi:hypothetical protein
MTRKYEHANFRTKQWQVNGGPFRVKGLLRILHSASSMGVSSLGPRQPCMWGADVSLPFSLV